MKKLTITSLFLLACICLFSQPANFTWKDRHNGKYNYISPPKDQKEQGPCRIFASVAAVEAIAQIYFNDTLPLDLSESNIYNGGAQCFPDLPNCSADVPHSLSFIVSDGIVNEECFKYPVDAEFYCRQDCNNICDYPDQLVTIPGYQELNIETDQELQLAILNHGPIIAGLLEVGHILHSSHGGTSEDNHTVLITGWQTTSELEWQVKSSWPGDSCIKYVGFDIFEYSCCFYYVEYVSGGNAIECSGSDCGIFSSRFYEDFDGDGFYIWGIGSKPDNCPGTCLMDFDDGDQSHIYLDTTTYLELPTPSISGPDLICHPNSDTFYFHNSPEDLTLEWEVTPSVYFNSPTSGTGDTVVITPNTPYIKECTFTFSISDACGSAEYSKDFIINGPDEDLISIEVEDAYGGTPNKYGDIWLLCPYTTYYIYVYNNSDCSTSGYSWDIPSGWTEYYHYSNYISINTNSNPGGTLEVLACTCCKGYNCNESEKIKIKTQYFSYGYNCGGYYSVYPNPASTEFTIKFSDKIDLETKDASLEIYDSFFTIKYVLKGFMKENTIYTNDWKEGLYYIRLKYNGMYYFNLLKIVH